MLVIGAPASGKTTLLRDLSRQLSRGAMGKYIKLCGWMRVARSARGTGGLVQTIWNLLHLLFGLSEGEGACRSPSVPVAANGDLR
jgi:stage III sporulation protein AA